MKKKVLLVGLSCFAAVLVFATTLRRQPTLLWKSDDPETLAKIRGGEPLGKSLEIRRDVELGLSGVKYPVSISRAQSGDVFVTDNNAQKIYKIPANASLAIPFDFHESPYGPLQWPNRIRAERDKIYISEERGIKTFDYQGRPIEMIRTFYSVFDFAPKAQGSIYVSPQFRSVSEDTPRLLMFAPDGRRDRKIGLASMVEDKTLRPIMTLGFLAESTDGLAVGYLHQPLLELWPAAGENPTIVELKHPSFDGLAALNADHTFTHPRSQTIRFSRYVAGVAVTRSKIFVALDLPWVQIQEFDFKGHKLNEFRWLGKKPITRYFGFDVDEEAGIATIGVVFDRGNSNRIVSLSGLH